MQSTSADIRSYKQIRNGKAAIPPLAVTASSVAVIVHADDADDGCDANDACLSREHCVAVTAMCAAVVV